MLAVEMFFACLTISVHRLQAQCESHAEVALDGFGRL